VDLTQARRLAFKVVWGQLAVTVLAGLVSLWVGGALAGLSALMGGGISTLASLAMALVAFGSFARGGMHRVLGAFFAGELAKLAVIIALFVLVLRTMTVSPGAWFAAYLATFLVYWIVLVGSLWSSTQPGGRG
jgi:ATP synthase protein I